MKLTTDQYALSDVTSPGSAEALARLQVLLGVDALEDPESVNIKLWRSLRAVSNGPLDLAQDSYLRKTACYIGALLDQYGIDDIQKRLIGSFGLTHKFAWSRGLSVARATPINDALTTNVVWRFYGTDRRLKVKLRLGCFLVDHNVFWDCGVVHIPQSMPVLARTLDFSQRAPFPYWAIKSASEAILRLIECVPDSMLDLTPEYYHMLPLSKYAGGSPVSPTQSQEAVSQVMNALADAIFYLEAPCMDNSTLMNTALRSAKRGHIPTLMASLLLWLGLLRDSHTGSPIKWPKPRFLAAP